MNKINVKEIENRNTVEDFAQAKRCDNFLYNKNGGPATWHRCFCDAVPRRRSIPESCSLVWHGQCIQRCR